MENGVKSKISFLYIRETSDNFDFLQFFKNSSHLVVFVVMLLNVTTEYPLDLENMEKS